MKRLTMIADFLRARFPLEKMDLESMLMKKEVPVHKMSWAYYLGGLTLLFFTIQVITGLLLLFYYQPTVTEAYDSVKFITEKEFQVFKEFKDYLTIHEKHVLKEICDIMRKNNPVWGV